MSKVKGCTNKNCTAYNVKISRKENFCSKCGSRLSYVCKSRKCDKILEESDGTYCKGCQIDKRDKRDKGKKALKVIAAPVVGVAGAAVTKVKWKDIANILSKIK